MTQRVAAQLDMRLTDSTYEWVFHAPTASGHIEKSTLKKQHKKALGAAKVEPFTLYTFRHTCLTRWAAFMDPYTLAYLAGHSDFSTTPPLRPSPSRNDQSRNRESERWA
jgi:integrase